MDILDFNTFSPTRFHPFQYGGHEIKYRAKINDEYWMAKFEGNLKQQRLERHQPWPSYDSSCISELLGSYIYADLGVPVQECKLGKYLGNLMVACKHIYGEFENIIEMREMLKNWVVENPNALQYNPNDTMIDLQQMFYFLAHDKRLSKFFSQIEQRFWDMFVIDALIGNNDRHMGNWALIFNDKTASYRVAPVYDNGSSFHSRWREEQFEQHAKLAIEDMKPDVFGGHTPYVAYKKRINAMKYINGNPCESCVYALMKLIPKINIQKYGLFIDELYSNKFISIHKRTYFKNFLRANYSLGLMPAYDQAIKQHNAHSKLPNLKESIEAWRPKNLEKENSPQESIEEESSNSLSPS